MALENLKSNILHQSRILREIVYFNDYSQKSASNTHEVYLINKTISSLLTQMFLVNKSLPEILKNISPVPSLKPGSSKKLDGSENLVEIKLDSGSITLNRKDKDRFMKESNLSSALIRKFKGKKAETISGLNKNALQPLGFYPKLSYFFFGGVSKKIVNGRKLNSLNVSLRKSNSRYLLGTYISMIFFSTVLAFLISVILGIVAYTLFGGFWAIILAVFIIPIVVFLLFYVSPHSDASSMNKKISSELPFMTLQMAAIANAEIEPSKIFSVILETKEYPNIRKEITKVINQVNLYGYDLVTALKNSAKLTSSGDLAELFNGIASTISSGGNLKSFLEKRAEGMLFDYKLERERYSKTAENFMNIYIAVVIAAPMIFLLLLILLGISGASASINVFELSLLIVMGVVIVNIIFLAVLHFKQPKY